MRIGLLSDTHGYLDSSIFKHFQHCDEIWHAGDIGQLQVLNDLRSFKPVRAVYGNIDGQDIRQETEEHCRFKIQGLDVWITHIGGYPPKYNRKILPLIKANPPNMFICGHSHILKVMSDEKLNNLLHLNPGAAGKHGFHSVRTLLRFEINHGKPENLEVIELGKRA